MLGPWSGWAWKDGSGATVVGEGGDKTPLQEPLGREFWWQGLGGRRPAPPSSASQFLPLGMGAFPCPSQLCQERCWGRLQGPHGGPQVPGAK